MHCPAPYYAHITNTLRNCDLTMSKRTCMFFPKLFTRLIVVSRRSGGCALIVDQLFSIWFFFQYSTKYRLAFPPRDWASLRVILDPLLTVQLDRKPTEHNTNHHICTSKSIPNLVSVSWRRCCTSFIPREKISIF